MKKRSIVLLLALAGAGYLALKNKKQAETLAGTVSETPAAAPATQAESAAVAAEPVVHLVEETLHKHEGEDNPVVHAVEEALEQKAGHADAPA